jgi:endonuclease/exonuclease/phosphatase family metal-dependent hydrolase
MRSARLRPCLVLTAAFALLAVAPAHAASTPLKVQTQNLDAGADLASVPLGAAWDAAKASDLPSRTQAVADEIAAADPDVIALQEVARWTATGPGEPSYDELELILLALGQRGLGYFVGAVFDGADTGPVALPSAADPQFTLRFQDRDVILVRDRAGLTFANPQHGAFALGSSGLRGWASIDGVVGDRAFRFVDTQLAEASELSELTDGPLSTSRAVIAAGDFGAPPVVPPGLTDIGARQNDFTCCQAADLLNAKPVLDRRSDLVLTAGTRARPSPKVEVVGDRGADRTPAGLWPSDHAGVVATVYP